MPLRIYALLPLCLLCLLGAGCVGVSQTQADLLRLRIGDTARKTSTVSVALDTIVDTARGEIISPQDLVERIRGHRLVLIGEQHTDTQFHTVQLRVLELLHAAGVPLSIGVEMFPASSQAVLELWTDGALTESEFIAESDWYRIWGYNWAYYRDIFEFARVHGIRVIGLNTPAAIDSSVDATAAVETKLESNDHRTLVRAFFGADSPIHGGLSAEQFDGLFAAQSRNDATMAQHAAQALDQTAQSTMVVLAGTGHVLYGLGIVRQLPESYQSSAITIVPVPIDADDRVVASSVADFVWGVPESPYPDYPELGVLTVQTPAGLHVIYVEPGSPGDAATIETGDTLTDVDGTPLTEKSDLARALADTRWGDVVSVGLSRDDARRVLAVALRR